MNFLIIGLIVYFALGILDLFFYIPRMKFWFMGYKKQPKLRNENKARFAVVVPARDESNVIGMLLDSLNRQTYPQDLFDVHVIVDNKNDPSIGKSQRILKNCFIHVVENQTRKADALDACFKNILKSDKHYDDYIIVDADCFLKDDFLEEMNNALITRAKIILPRKSSKNWESKNKKNRNVIANCGTMTWTGVDTMGNKGKSKKGYTLSLCGQGILIDAELVNSWQGYPFRTITEDYELAVECMRHGYKQYYYEHAILYSEEVTSHKEFNKRRMRWIRGFAQVTKLFNKEVKQITFKQGKVKKENLFYLYGAIPCYLIFGIHGAGFTFFAVSSIVLGIMGNPLWFMALMFMLIPIIHCYLQLMFFAILSVSQDKDINKMTLWEKIKFILVYPLIMFEYVYVFAIAFTKTFDGTWEKIKRIEM